MNSLFQELFQNNSIEIVVYKQKNIDICKLYIYFYVNKNQMNKKNGIKMKIIYMFIDNNIKYQSVEHHKSGQFICICCE